MRLTVVAGLIFGLSMAIQSLVGAHARAKAGHAAIVSTAARLRQRQSNGVKGNLIACETRRGFHASLGRGDPCIQY